ncbi:MAG: hypothetical protein OXB84_07010, partial [Halobacteriovoraceae bacterium]|nr:hypothetical protein [Halobacteriovoraceae bacterium]
MKLEQLLKEAESFQFDKEIDKKNNADRKLFLKRWPIEKIKSMTKEEYFGIKRDHFCYWLEFKDILASIGGGGASKFGIYKSKESGKYIKGSLKLKNRVELNDEQADKELEKIKKFILNTIQLAKEGRIEEIEEMENPIWHGVLLKILIVYVPENFFTITSKKIFLALAKTLDSSYSESLKAYSRVGLNFHINKKLNNIPPFKEWSNDQRGRFLLQPFGHLIGNRRKHRNINIVGYYLSRFGDEYKDKRFPKKSWKEIFSMFIDKLGDPELGKSGTTSFCNSLKIARDRYDSHHDNSREGYKEKDGAPIKLSRSLKKIYDQYQSHSEEYLWKIVKKYISDRDGEIDEELEDEAEFPLNQIIYGPPGTGKTYSIVEKALKIIDGETFDDLQGIEKRTNCLNRFNELKKSGNIEFITFHQSYSYEEFIEGIVPEVNSEGNVSYEIRPGVFKSFVNRARNKEAKQHFSEISENPTVWRMSLFSRNNQTFFQNCLDEGLICLDYNIDENFEETDVDDYFSQAQAGKNSFNMFINDMQLGDLVCIFNTTTSIRAIGIITSDYCYNNTNEKLPKHTRKVKWIDTEVRDIFEPNGRKRMMTPTIHRLSHVVPSKLIELIDLGVTKKGNEIEEEIEDN